MSVSIDFRFELRFGKRKWYKIPLKCFANESICGKWQLYSVQADKSNEVFHAKAQINHFIGKLRDLNPNGFKTSLYHRKQRLAPSVNPH